MILITGGTGFVGGFILEALDEKKIPRGEIRVMSRAGAGLDKLRSKGYDTVAGSVTEMGDIRRAVQGVDTVIHLVAIIREAKGKGQTFDSVIGEGTENVAEAAREAQGDRVSEIDTGEGGAAAASRTALQARRATGSGCNAARTAGRSHPSHAESRPTVWHLPAWPHSLRVYPRGRTGASSGRLCVSDAGHQRCAAGAQKARL